MLRSYVAVFSLVEHFGPGAVRDFGGEAQHVPAGTRCVEFSKELAIYILIN
jgi:hypothetical protein